MYKLPQGVFTLVIGFVPPVKDHVTVSVVSTSLNIGQEATSPFSKYSRSIIHLHKYDGTPPEYFYVDLKCQGIANSPSQRHGHLIVYGIEGKRNDVSSDVFDELYYLENSKLTIKTAVEFQTANFNGNVDMKNHQIKNVQDGIENNDTVNIKQLNEFDDLVKFFRREMQTTIDDLNNKIIKLTTKADHTEKQIARMALHDQLFKRIFEIYADLLDPEEFKRSGPNVTAFNDLNVVTSTGSPSGKPFSNFNLRLQYTFRGVSRASDVARAV